MRLFRKPALLLTVGLGFAAVFILLGLLGQAQPALAQELDREVNEQVSLAPAQQQPDSQQLGWGVVFTDPALVDITDLLGNPVGEGFHIGDVRCNKNTCNHETQLTFSCCVTGTISYKVAFTGTIIYKVYDRLEFDPVNERLVVAGRGTLSSNGMRAKFSFTATFQNNGDGTVWVKYESSRPDASFIIPAAPGTFIYKDPKN